MLGITVWLDGENVGVTGTIDPESVIVHTPSSAGYSPFSLPHPKPHSAVFYFPPKPTLGSSAI